MVLLVGLEDVVLQVGQQLADPRVHHLVLDVGVHGQQLDHPIDELALARVGVLAGRSKSLNTLRICLWSSLSMTMASLDMLVRLPASVVLCPLPYPRQRRATVDEGPQFAATAPRHSIAGSRHVAVVPRPSSDASSIVPEWRRTIRSHDREPEAGPGRAIASGLVERKNSRNSRAWSCLGDADARVGDADDHVLAPPGPAHVDAPPSSEYLIALLREVGQHPVQLLGASGHQDRLVGHVEAQLLRRLGGGGRHSSSDVEHDLAQVDLLGHELVQRVRHLRPS